MMTVILLNINWKSLGKHSQNRYLINLLPCQFYKGLIVAKKASHTLYTNNY